MDKIKELFERLPKWARIGLPIVLAVLIIYVIYKNKGSASSSTLSVPAVGAADSGSSSGLPATSDNTTTPAVIPTVVTPSPKHNPQMASAAEIKWANHWGAQDAKNARKFGVNNPGSAKANANMTEAQAAAAGQRNKGIAEGLAAKAHYHAPAKVTTKSRTVAVSHVANKASGKEGPKRGNPAPLKTTPKVPTKSGAK
jgi:hypothetical protein